MRGDAWQRAGVVGGRRPYPWVRASPDGRDPAMLSRGHSRASPTHIRPLDHSSRVRQCGSAEPRDGRHLPPIEAELGPYRHLFKGRVLNAGAGSRDISDLVDGELFNQDIKAAPHIHYESPLHADPGRGRLLRHDHLQRRARARREPGGGAGRVRARLQAGRRALPLRPVHAARAPRPDRLSALHGRRPAARGRAGTASRSASRAGCTRST